MPRFIAALAHLRDGHLLPFESIEFDCASEDDAKRKANLWRVRAGSTIGEQTWLIVKRYDSGVAIMSAPPMPTRRRRVPE